MQKRPNPPATSTNQLPFTAANYRMLGLGTAVLALGYFLLSSDKFVDATQFSVPLYIAPLVIIAGLLVILYSILLPKGKAK